MPLYEGEDWSTWYVRKAKEYADFIPKARDASTIYRQGGEELAIACLPINLYHRTLFNERWRERELREEYRKVYAAAAKRAEETGYSGELDQLKKDEQAITDYFLLIAKAYKEPEYWQAIRLQKQAIINPQAIEKPPEGIFDQLIKPIASVLWPLG